MKQCGGGAKRFYGLYARLTALYDTHIKNNDKNKAKPTSFCFIFFAVCGIIVL